MKKIIIGILFFCLLVSSVLAVQEPVLNEPCASSRTIKTLNEGENSSLDFFSEGSLEYIKLIQIGEVSVVEVNHQLYEAGVNQSIDLDYPFSFTIISVNESTAKIRISQEICPNQNDVPEFSLIATLGLVGLLGLYLYKKRN